jgi:hypothetical protein
MKLKKVKFVQISTRNSYKNLELSVGPFPSNATGIGRVAQELQEKLPQLDLPRTCKDKNENEELSRLGLRPAGGRELFV